MNNQEFVHFCYKRILQRSPEQESLIHYTNALDSKHLSREDLIITFFACQEFESITLSQEFVPTGHFYSAVPSFEERQAFAASNVENNNVIGITLNEERQIDFLNQFKRYYDECPFTDHKGKEFRYYFLNPAYSYADALTLYSMMRYFRPKRIIEIGSGFSSCAMLDTSEHYFNGEIDFTFIEPYPELLYGDKLTMTTLGLNLSYEILHNLFGQLYFTYSNTTDENELRTPEYQLGRKYSVGVSFGYGF